MDAKTSRRIIDDKKATEITRDIAKTIEERNDALLGTRDSITVKLSYHFYERT